jgi:putative ABC transport system permease protein
MILKYASKSILRAKGRNLLIGIIVVVIASASCIALSIQNAANAARTQGLANVNVTAQITIDQEKLRNQMQSGSGSAGQRGARMQMPQLTLSDYEKYSAFDEVEDFYYTLQTSLNKAGDTFAPYTDDSTLDQDAMQSMNQTPNPGGKAGADSGRPRMMIAGMTADFSLTGYSSEDAMTNFTKDKTNSVVDGELFEFETAKVDDAYYPALINKTLAHQNGVNVGDTFTLTNPGNNEEAYSFKITGFYESTTTEDNQMAGVQTAAAMKPDNAIYVNALSLAEIVENSKIAPKETTSPMGGASTSELRDQVNATYVLGDKAGYDKFVEDVASAGLDSNFKVFSQDVETYTKSLVPLDNLSKFASVLLLIILLVGAVILVVLTAFNIRERKYEVGVYTAIGIKKPKVALQFACELLIVVLLGVGVGAGAGVVASAPVADSMLAGQIAAVQAEDTQNNQAFGRPGASGPGGPGGQGMQNRTAPNVRVGGVSMIPGNNVTDVEYLSQVGTSVDAMTILELIGIGILLTALASIVSVVFVMRFEPLQILADR